jgi:hypothetical protein
LHGEKELLFVEFISNYDDLETLKNLRPKIKLIKYDLKL